MCRRVIGKVFYASCEEKGKQGNKMNKLKKNKTGISTLMIVAAVVVIVVVAVAVGAFAFLSRPAAPSNTNPTSAPGATSSTETPGSESSETADVAGASSLKYSVSVAENGVVKSSYTFWGKNVGKADFAMRIEYSDENGKGVYIFNAGKKEAWTNAGDGEWIDMSSYFDLQYDIWAKAWSGYVSSLASWTGTGDYSYTAEGFTYRIYDISINPTLEDSLFSPN